MATATLIVTEAPEPSALPTSQEAADVLTAACDKFANHFDRFVVHLPSASKPQRREDAPDQTGDADTCRCRSDEGALMSPPNMIAGYPAPAIDTYHCDHRLVGLHVRQVDARSLGRGHVEGRL